MKTRIVLNACTSDYKEQVAMLAGLLTASEGLPEPEAWILCHTGCREQELLCEIPSRHAVIFQMEDYSAESVLDQLAQWTEADDLLLFPGNYFGTEISGRLAFRLGGTAQNAVTRVRCTAETLYAARPAYGGHMEGEFCMSRLPCCITASRSLEAEVAYSAEIAARRQIVPNKINHPVQVISFEKDPPATGLAQAQVVLAIGRGAKTQADVTRAALCAKQLGAELGCSRPVVMSAWAPMDRLLGVSGIVAKPEICIAVGVSGAPAFYAGVEKSKLLVAVNSDAAAPIHKKADWCIVGDMWEFLEETLAACKE